MRTLELINAGKYRQAENRFALVDRAKAKRRARILNWAANVAAMAIDQQSHPEYSADLPGYRDCLEQDLCDALREHVPNMSPREYETALLAFRAALPAQFND